MDETSTHPGAVRARRQRPLAWWLARTSPTHIQPHTLREREIIRKSRLFSVSLLRAFFLTLPILVALSIPHFTATTYTSVFFYASLALALWLNKRGQMTWAALCYVLGGNLYIYIAAQSLPYSLHMLGWICLSAIPALLAGLYLPFWTPPLFSLLNGVITAVLLSQQHSDLHIPAAYQVPFIMLIAFFQLFIALNGMTYAQSTERAVIEADRAAELELMNRHLERMATIDPITGLANHRTFADMLAVVFKRCDAGQAQKLSLIFADLDHFKRINDTWGHQAGDAVLAHVAALLRRELAQQPQALVARYGGEEFVMLLPEIDVTGALAIAEGVCATVASTPVLLNTTGPASARTITTTLSLGVATYSAATATAADLIAAADAAMYAAKHAGRNRAYAALTGLLAA